MLQRIPVKAQVAANQRLAEKLRGEGRISFEEFHQAVGYATRNQCRIEDALIELDIVEEAELLSYIGKLYGTKFVSTDKLFKAQIDPRILALVTAKTADLHGVYPLLYDGGKQSLVVATSDPDNDTALKEIRIGAGVKEVQAIVARPAAVRAAIARAYQRDNTPFERLVRHAMTVVQQSDSLDLGAAPPPMRRSMGSGPDLGLASGLASGLALDHGNPTPGVDTGFARRSNAPPALDLPRPHTGGSLGDRASPAPPQPRQGTNAGRRPGRRDPTAAGQQVHAPILSLSSAPPPPMAPAAVARSAARIAPLPPRPPAGLSLAPPVVPSMMPGAAPQEVTLARDFVEMVSVLVGIAEATRADLKGHSSIVSRLMERMARRLGQNSAGTAAFVVAGHLHDVGKQGSFHLTALNVAEYDGHKVAAQKVSLVIDRLFSKVALSTDARAAVATMYERFDGKGLPTGLAGNDIPLGGRVLAIVDTYADLTHNARNPYRRILKPQEACDVMSSFKGTVFDPHLIEVFRPLALGDDIRARLLVDQPTVLIVDPVAEETDLIEARLNEQGFDVRSARTLQQAFYELQSNEIDVVVSEIDLDVSEGGITLRAAAKEAPWGRELVWVMLAKRSDREMAQAAFAMGVDDFVAKPANADVLVAKLVQLVDRHKAKMSSRGVSGSLAEMGLPDMVQILWHGRKTCNLRIDNDGQRGEIHFSAGQIIHALWADLKGEEAFYKMITLADGTFRMDPAFEPKQKTITNSPEGLLLEGMRRLDEAANKGA